MKTKERAQATSSAKRQSVPPESGSSFDVIVAGGGPGGSGAAALLGKLGYNVLLLDKMQFPRDKTCGDAVSGKSLRVVRELGIDKLIEKSPHGEIRGVIFSSPKGVAVDIPMKGESTAPAPGYCCRREVLDDLIFQTAKKYASMVVENFQITGLLKEGEQVVGVKGIHLQTKQNYEYRAKVVVGADGAHSLVAKETGRYSNDPNHSCVALRAYYKNVKEVTDRIELHFIDEVIPGYFWIFPVEKGYSNVGVGMLVSDMQKRNVNLKDSMLKAIENNPLFKERFKGAELEGDIKAWTLPLGSYRRNCAGPGFVLVGDAASLIDPFTGEGIGNALTSAKIASEVIASALKSNDFSANKLSEYNTRLWKELGPELKTSYNMQRWGTHRWLVNMVIDKAARSAKMREFIGATFTNEEAKKEFTHPLFYLKLLLS